MSLYSKRGVSAQKEEVHAATQNIDKGLYPRAFCKIYPDILGGDEAWVNLMHADGAGTKSILAYLYWKETGDISIWKGIAQDAIVMNLDDLLCVGIYDNLLFSSSIDRNKARIPGEVLKVLIESTQEFLDGMNDQGVRIAYLGGETADVGDVVRTVAVNGTMAARWPKSKLITNERIEAGNVIVGLSSFGQANYEKEYNSGIGSNGLTSARHDLLSNHYSQFRESFDELLPPEVVYIGKRKLSDIVKINYRNEQQDVSVGKLILSPTRTYAPFVSRLLEEGIENVFGLIHCSGGGQTKCLKYLPSNVKIYKDNLFDAPPVFELIQQSSGSDNREMYQVFNMGCRLEVYTSEHYANSVIQLAQSLGLEAQVIGRVEESTQLELELSVGKETINYQPS